MKSGHSFSNHKLRLAVDEEKAADAVSLACYRVAVEEEKLAAAASLTRYKLLSTKITQYQMGGGAAPTEDEFNQWLADVQRAVELRQLLAGIPVT